MPPEDCVNITILADSVLYKWDDGSNRYVAIDDVEDETWKRISLEGPGDESWVVEPSLWEHGDNPDYENGDKYCLQLVLDSYWIDDEDEHHSIFSDIGFIYHEFDNSW